MQLIAAVHSQITGVPAEDIQVGSIQEMRMWLGGSEKVPCVHVVGLLKTEIDAVARVRLLEALGQIFERTLRLGVAEITLTRDQPTVRTSIRKLELSYQG